MTFDRIRAGLRRHMPQPLRRFVGQARRRAAQAQAGRGFSYTTKQTDAALAAHFVCAIDVVQPIRRTTHFEGKLHNIGLAVSRLDRLSLGSGEAVSFWQAVGVPTVRNGFQLGRGIVADRLGADVGGGLCQIASMLYELGVRAGCKILERHAHSRDLYTEDNRYTPLGLDAAVAWGFKDVRIANTLPCRIVFAFDVEGATLRGRLLVEAPIQVLDLEVVRHDDGQRRTAQVTSRKETGEAALVSCDDYIIDPT